MTVLDLVRRYRRAEGWRGLAEFAALLALDNQTIANHDNNQHAADENLRLGNLWYGVDLFSQLLTTPPVTMEPPR